MRSKVYHPTSPSAILARNPAFGDPMHRTTRHKQPSPHCHIYKTINQTGQACYIAILPLSPKVSKGLVAIALMLPPNL